MRRLLTICIGALALTGHAASPAATQAWVSNYVANTAAELARNAVTTTAGGVETTIIPVDSGGFVSNMLEQATIGGLLVSDAQPSAVSAGVTNGMLFAWNGTDAYVNGAHVISATASNLTYSVYSTAEFGVDTWLVDANTNRFCVLNATLVQPSVASWLIGGGL